jgi:hypothetical protein
VKGRVSRNRFPQLVRALTLGARELTEKVAEKGAEFVKAEAPVLTGHLRSTVKAVKRNQHRTDVVVEADYAGYVNYGTRRQAANPFFDRGLKRAAAWKARNEKKILVGRLK